MLNDRICVIGGYYNGYRTASDEVNPSTSTGTARATLKSRVLKF